MKSILMILLAVILGFTVTGQKKKELVTPVNVNYCLPKASYEVSVTMECTKCIPGPYRNYAEKELGVKPEITEPSERWIIRDIRIKPMYIPDEKAVYSISASGDYNPLMLRLSAEGFLAGVSAGQGGVYNEEKKMKYIVDEGIEEKVIDIMKLNTYNHLKEILDTNYTYQQVDGEMKKIWDPIIRYAVKTEKDNVKEAVSEIFRIRSERVKLLGAENNVPDGKSLEIILKGFERMEDNYLSLFMGKKESKTVVRMFECVPSKQGEEVVAFRFTEDKGVVEAKNVSAPAYLLKFENVVVPASNPVNGTTTEAAVFYRVPAVADLKLVKNNQELVSFRTIVPQFGETKKIPVDVISNEGLLLEFYPQFGSLKSISKK